MNNIEKTDPNARHVTPFGNHVEKMEKRIKHWGAELDKLAQSALTIEVSQREAHNKHVVDLQAKFDLAQAKLEALRGAGERKWEAFKEELELSVRSLEKALKS